jgi:hypothetical protein
MQFGGRVNLLKTGLRGNGSMQWLATKFAGITSSHPKIPEIGNSKE